jgi:uncharacterized protein (TIGR02266 family)
VQCAAIVIPVRFVSQGFAVQTTSRELGSAGIEVRCKRPPKAGARVSMALYLPGGNKPEIAVGMVGSSDAQRGTFWADFLAIDAEARMRIEALVHRSPHDVRRIEVSFLSAREFVLEYARNLSRGGLFVEMANPPPLSTLLDVAIRLPDRGPVVRARAVVVHRVGADEAQQGGRVGAGVQFVGPAPEMHQRLDRYMAELADQSALS